MSIVVTGATGHLGRLVVEALLERGVPADRIVATGRSTGKLDDLAARGVTVRRADFAEPAGLAAAFSGADKVLLVSASEVGLRRAQHRNAVDAAAAAGVTLLAYTSILRADSSSVLLAADHRATEEYIRASGLRYVFLRNGWYLENYVGQIAGALENGVVLGAAGDGLISAATRTDYAQAAAEVLSGDGPTGVAYELGGEVLASADAGVARGDLHDTAGTLSALIGRPTTSLRAVVAAAVG